MIWPLLIPWALILLDLRIDLGILRYIAWNAGLIMLFSFGMQGVGILQTILDGKEVSRGIRTAITVLMILVLFLPGVNFIVLIGLPGLGISELWIHYRRVEKKE